MSPKEKTCKDCTEEISERELCKYHHGYAIGFSASSNGWRKKIERLLIK